MKVMREEKIAAEQEFLAEQASARRRALRVQIALNVVGVILFLIVWEIAPRVAPRVNIEMFPPPSGIVGTLWEMIANGQLLEHTLVSLQRAAIGYALGAATGIMVGVVTGQFAAMRMLSDPVLQGLRSIPAIAFVPLALVWFGLGEASKVFLIAWGTFFPVWINTYIGVRDVPTAFLRSAASLGANRWRIMFLVVLPAAIPFILAGLRLGTAIALVVLVAAELVGASSGLGFLISYSHLVFRVDMMFVGLMALGVLGFLTDRVFVALVPRLFPWYGGESRR